MRIPIKVATQVHRYKNVGIQALNQLSGLPMTRILLLSVLDLPVLGTGYLGKVLVRDYVSIKISCP
jgi:hypothetical protein